MHGDLYISSFFSSKDVIFVCTCCAVALVYDGRF